jgi:hypothetical protein
MATSVKIFKIMVPCSALYSNMYKYIQRDATVSRLLFQELYQELYMFRAFTMPIIRSNIRVTCRVLEIKAKIQLHLGYIYTFCQDIKESHTASFKHVSQYVRLMQHEPLSQQDNATVPSAIFIYYHFCRNHLHLYSGR